MGDKLHIWRKYRPLQPAQEIDAVHELTRFGGFNEQQARAISHVLDQREDVSKNDYREAFLTIERWAQRNNVGQFNFPFVVVAGDGSGDYLTPGAAIDAIAAGTPTIVYITPGTYADTGPMNLVGKQIVLFGLGPFPNLSWDTTVPGPLVIWQVATALVFTSDTTSELTIYNMNMTQGGVNPHWTNDLGLQLLLIDMQNATSAYGVGVDVTAYRSKVLFGIAGAGGGTLSGLKHHFVGCEVITNAGATQTLTELGHTEWIDCVIDFNTTIVFRASTATNNNKSFVMRDCTFISDGAGILTVDNGDWDQVQFVGNTNQNHKVAGPSRSNYLPVANFTASNIVCSGNNLDGTDLNIVGCDKFQVDGLYETVNLNDGAGTINVMVGTPAYTGPTNGVLIATNNVSGSVSGDTATNILNVTGSFNAVVVAGVNFTNLVNVSGNDNKFVVMGEVLTLGVPTYDGAPAAAFADTGARNTFV